MKPVSSSTRCSKSRIQAITAGSVEVVGADRDVTSPETPVAFWSSSTLLQRRQVARDELADVGDHLGSGCRPPSRRWRARAAIASTRPGAAIETASARPPQRTDPTRDGRSRLRRSSASLPGSRADLERRAASGERRLIPAASATAPRGRRSARPRTRRRPRPRAAGRSRGPSGSATAAGRGSRPRSRTPRSRSPARPGRPPRPRRGRAMSPARVASLKRAWNWIA